MLLKACIKLAVSVIKKSYTILLLLKEQCGMQHLSKYVLLIIQTCYTEWKNRKATMFEYQIKEKLII